MQTPERTIAQWFKENEFKWSLLNRGPIIPDEADVEAALDEGARILYDEPVGTRLSVGRLIIERTETGHDIFMFVGSYE